MPNFAVRKVLSGSQTGPSSFILIANIMATITIQKKLSAMTEQIATAEQLEGVFNKDSRGSQARRLEDSQ